MPTNRYISPFDLDDVWHLAGKIVAGCPQSLDDVEIAYYARRRELTTGCAHPQSGILRDFNPDLPAFGEPTERYEAARKAAAEVIEKVIEQKLPGKAGDYLKQASAALLYRKEDGSYPYTPDMVVKMAQAYMFAW